METHMKVGTKYRVRYDHSYHPSREGIFRFMGGPKEDVVVLSDPEDEHLMFAVGMEDIEKTS